MITHIKKTYILLLLLVLGFSSCKDDNKKDPTPQYSSVTQKIVDSTDLVATVFSDTSFQVYPGVEETDIHYLNMDGKTMHIFILKVDLNQEGVSLEVATPFDANEYNAQSVPNMAKYIDEAGHRVVAGINGDFFNTSTLVPMGIVYKNGNAIKDSFSDNSEKVQQGLTFFGILEDGSPIIGDRVKDYPAVKSALKEATGGGVVLVEDHKPVVQPVPTIAPRTAIGVTEDNIVYFIVADGRDFDYSNGISYAQLSSLMVALDVKDAINVDGGGSSTLMIDHPLADVWQVRNRPSDGSPRAVTNAWMVIADTQ